MSLLRRQFLRLAAGAAVLPALSHGAWALDYPARPVRLVVPVPPGGALDVLARLISQWLSEKQGQPFIVENRPGDAALADPQIGTRLANLGSVPAPIPPADFKKFIIAETEKWAKLIKVANIRLTRPRSKQPVRTHASLLVLCPRGHKKILLGGTP
jgi:tripartite-type tricarboxylate transporter receptor subunit TctC